MPTVPVNPSVLEWARESAGLSLEDAAQKASITGARGLTGAERLAVFEVGGELPTRHVLLRLAKAYHRPLLSLYLDEPPQKGERGEDFRRVEEVTTPKLEGLVDALVRDAKVRQSILRSALEDEEEDAPKPFVGSLALRSGPESVARSISDTIGFDRNTFRRQSNLRDAFSYARTRAESAGVFVLLLGDLGSHHTALPAEVFRGLALADPVAPFIVVNDQDAKGAWAFTLFHELAHLWLGRTGISSSGFDGRVEQFCNDVAAKILIDQDELAPVADIGEIPLADAIARIDEFASRANLSRTMVSYQLLRSGLIPNDRWELLRDEFKRLWLETRAADRRAARAAAGGPNYFVLRRFRAGGALVSLVSRLMKSGTLTSTRAAKVLGVKARSVYDVVSS